MKKTNPSKTLRTAAQCGDPAEVLAALRLVSLRDELESRPEAFGRAVGTILSRSRLTWRPLGQALATIMVELSNEEVSPEFLQGLVDSNGPSGLAKVISDHHIHTALRTHALDWLTDYPILVENLSQSDKQFLLRQSEVLTNFSVVTRFFSLVLSDHFNGVTVPLQAVDSALCRLKPSNDLLSLVHLLLLRSRKVSGCAELPSEVISLLVNYAQKSGGLWLSLVMATWRYRKVNADLLWGACRHYHEYRSRFSSKQDSIDDIAAGLITCSDEDVFNGLYRGLMKLIVGEHNPPPRECWIGVMNMIINSTVARKDSFVAISRLIDEDHCSWLKEVIRAQPCIERILADDLKAIDLIYKVGLRGHVLAYNTEAIVHAYQQQHWPFLRSLLRSYPNQVVSKLTPLRVLKRPMDQEFRDEFLLVMKARPGLWDPYCGYDFNDYSTDSELEFNERSSKTYEYFPLN
ncbi:hypothetical protein Pmar_PMAR028280 [Perkinsus marinus ATCC 50983]|uniref:Uncharacterized protein n=1 Tax=Perkinsus marinus (strain ATCC 50983 / TXsc) TaxID=423536 RepID=C5LN31_PERM5|nr:hypothetical protein Pmar_PMAR028280 [Perkinsus marinus ATCC 50983]EER01830.1 hypothetical protein Pmar_PMAR028280 [Perkinsus marinus ATCC 50983]|eukprot:XP_002769112.1 hypothetical protein Pmar_PMAR028280 [Perkinsus marinus ATCC 50983]